MFKLNAIKWSIGAIVRRDDSETEQGTDNGRSWDGKETDNRRNDDQNFKKSMRLLYIKYEC
jgi:hypothetical protein